MRTSTKRLLIILTILLGITCSGLEKKVGCWPEPLYSAYALEGMTVNSPDGKNRLTVKILHDEKHPDGDISYRVAVGGKHFSSRLGGWDTEVLWSPDSKAFSTNQTEGGGGIGHRAYVFYLTDVGLRRVDVSAPVEKAFGSPVKCEVPVPPNTAILKWLDSKRILVVAEVVPVSICKCSGTFQTYEVSLPDLEILRVHSQAETRRLFGGALGCELRGADDRCARSWQTAPPNGISRAHPTRDLRETPEI